jgi:hypothetical protein
MRFKKILEKYPDFTAAMSEPGMLWAVEDIDLGLRFIADASNSDAKFYLPGFKGELPYFGMGKLPSGLVDYAKSSHEQSVFCIALHQIPCKRKSAGQTFTWLRRQFRARGFTIEFNDCKGCPIFTKPGLTYYVDIAIDGYPVVNLRGKYHAEVEFLGCDLDIYLLNNLLKDACTKDSNKRL